MPIYSVILTPCCSIGPKTITLTPLIQIKPSFFENPFFKGDLTKINLEMMPEEAVPPSTWQKLPPEERKERLEEGKAYALKELFIYQEHSMFPSYNFTWNKDTFETKYYMVDFKAAYQLECDRIQKNGKADPKILESKCLQLSVETRDQLRKKISSYYARIPKEDKPLLQV